MKLNQEEHQTKQFHCPGQALDAGHRVSFCPYFPSHHHTQHFAAEEERELNTLFCHPKILTQQLLSVNDQAFARAPTCGRLWNEIHLKKLSVQTLQSLSPRSVI